MKVILLALQMCLLEKHSRLQLEDILNSKILKQQAASLAAASNGRIVISLLKLRWQEDRETRLCMPDKEV